MYNEMTGPLGSQSSTGGFSGHAGARRVTAGLNHNAPPPIREAFALLGRIIARVALTCAGSLGVYALVCAARHPHADAALVGALLLIGCWRCSPKAS